MNKYLAILIVFLVLFLLIFLIDYFLFKKNHYKKKKRKKKSTDLVEIAYLSGKFKINKDILVTSRVLKQISCINAFIISFVCIVILLIPIYIIFQLLIGFILLMALIYSLYELYGRALVKKGFDNNGK